MRFDHWKVKFDKVLQEAKDSKRLEKLLVAVSDARDECNRDNIWVHNAGARLDEFKKYSAEEIKRLEAEVKRTQTEHIEFKRIYDYAKEQLELVLPKPKPKIIPPTPVVVDKKSTKKKVTKTIEVEEDEIPPVVK